MPLVSIPRPFASTSMKSYSCWSQKWLACSSRCGEVAQSVERPSKGPVSVQIYWCEFESRPRHKVVGKNVENKIIILAASLAAKEIAEKACSSLLETTSVTICCFSVHQARREKRPPLLSSMVKHNWKAMDSTPSRTERFILIFFLIKYPGQAYTNSGFGPGGTCLQGDKQSMLISYKQYDYQEMLKIRQKIKPFGFAENGSLIRLDV